MSKLPSTGPSLLRELRRRERQALRQAQSSSFNRSGVAPTAEDVTEVSGQMQSADFDGDLAAGDAGTKGWAMNRLRAAFGELFLRPGSVGNDALTNPVAPGLVYFTATHTLTAATQTVATATITVPAGFTSAVVVVSARAGGTNQNTTGGVDGLGGDYLGIDVTVGSVVGGGKVFVPGGTSYGECVAFASDVLTGLTPGGTFAVPVRAAADYFTWTAGVFTVVNGSILWFR